MNLNQNADTLDAAALESLGAEDLLSLDIAQLADVEAFKLLPAGLYGWEVTGAEITEVGAENKKAISVQYKILECMETSNPEEAEEVGELPREYKELYFLEGGKGFGVRTFATMFRPIAVGAGVSQISDILEAAVGASGGGMIKKRGYKKDGEQKYSNNIDATTVEWA